MEAQPATPARVRIEAPVAVALEPARWNAITRVAFRFFFAYFILYNFPFPLNYIPGSYVLWALYTRMWYAIEVWVGMHLLRLTLPITSVFNGSGDRTFDYVEVLCFLIVAVAATAVWSVMDRRRPEYRQLHQWLRLYVRLALGATLILYGAGKVIKAQFPPILLSTLVEPYGESSPMRLLWSFMGYSLPYNIFTGAIEMLAGSLLCVPRLATLGGLVATAAMANVFMLNMSYDVPVKLSSFHLLAMSMFVVSPDLRRLANFFLFNRQVEAALDPSIFRRPWLNRCVLGLQLLLGVVFATQSLLFSYQTVKAYGAPKPPLYGIWSVEEFMADGEPRAALVTDDVRWQSLIFERYRPWVTLRKMSGEGLRYILALDLAKRKFTLHKFEDPNWKADLAIDQQEPDLIVLDGQMDGHKIQAKMRRQPERTYPILNRGFHWINEYPFSH
jgi:hypothetical protein